MRAKFVFERLGFTETGDPIKDMEIGHDAQMAKLDKQIKWDWYTKNYPFNNTEEIVDIIEYRDFHLRITKVIPLKIVRDKKTGDVVQYFYVAIPDTGEPYTADGPYTWDTPEEALKSGKAGLDNYIDD